MQQNNGILELVSLKPAQARFLRTVQTNFINQLKIKENESNNND